jgi:YggT family protein
MLRYVERSRARPERSAPMRNSLIFIVDALSNLYVSMFVLRFILQWIRASYQNPLAQFVLRVTAPLVVPARRMLPSVRGLDLPTLVVAILLECVATALVFSIVGFTPSVPTFIGSVVLRLLSLTLWLYCGMILIYVIMSWVADRQYHPIGAALYDIVEPVLRPVRRYVPPIAGVDLSPLIVVILLQAIIIALPSLLFVP